MSAVLVLTIYTISRDLISFFFHKNSHCSMLQTCIHCSVKQSLDLLRLCGCGDVPVIRAPSQNGITHTAAYHIGFIACFFQYMQNYFRVFRYFQNHMTILIFFYLFLTPKTGTQISLLPVFFIFLLISMLFPSKPSSWQVFHSIRRHHLNVPAQTAYIWM